MPQDPNMPRPDMTLDEFEDAVGKHLGVPKALRRALVEQESGGNVNATSYKGARGRYQVMPDTAAKYGMDTNNPFDNVYAGLRYLKEKYDEVSPDITDEGSRWKAALAGYHGGERQIRAINKTGEIASGSDGLKTTSDYADTIMKRWAKFAQEEVGTPPVDEYGRATVDETGRPIKWQSVNKPAPAKPPAPKIESKGPVRKPAPLPTFGGDPTQQMLQDVAARPVTKQKQGEVLPTKPNRFQQRSTAGQIGEILTSGAMRGVEGLYKAASIAHPQAWGKGLMTPEAQQALQQQEAEQDVEYPTAAPVARGLTTAGVQAPVYMAGGAAGLPAAMLTAGYMNAAQEDWSKDPVRSAVRTGINATLPFAASRGANALIRPITRPGVVATESIAGAAGNVVPEAIEQMAFEGQLDPQRLAQTGLMGGLSPLNVTGAGRQAEANQRARLAKVQKATGSPVTAEAAPEVAPEAAPATPEEAATPRYTPTPEVEQGVTVADRARTRVQSARDSGDVVGEINALEGERQAVKAAMASVGRRDAIGRRALGERLASIDQEISQAKAKARGKTPQQPQTPPETPFRETPSAEQQRIPRTPTPDENAPTADLTEDLVPTERELDVPDTGAMPPPLDAPITEGLIQPEPPQTPAVRPQYGRRVGSPVPGEAQRTGPREGRKVKLVVEGQEKEATLTLEQAKAWDDAERSYQEARRNTESDTAIAPSDKAKKLKGLAMKHAARKREIAGVLTGKEQDAATKREASNYKGKRVSVDGREGEVVGNAFGKVKVQFDDGTTSNVTPDTIQTAPKPKAPPLPSRWAARENVQPGRGQRVGGRIPGQDTVTPEVPAETPPPVAPQRGVNTIFGRRSGTPIPGRQGSRTQAQEAIRTAIEDAKARRKPPAPPKLAGVRPQVLGENQLQMPIEAGSRTGQGQTLMYGARPHHQKRLNERGRAVVAEQQATVEATATEADPRRQLAPGDYRGNRYVKLGSDDAGKLASYLFESNTPESIAGESTKGREAFLHDPDVKGALGLTKDAGEKEIKEALNRELAGIMNIRDKAGRTPEGGITLRSVPVDVWKMWARRKSLPASAMAKFNRALRRLENPDATPPTAPPDTPQPQRREAPVRRTPASDTGRQGDAAAAETPAAPRATEPRPAAEPATRAAEQPARAAEQPVEPVTPETPPVETPAPKPRRAAKPAAKTTAPKVNEKTLTDAGWQKKSPAEFTHPDGREIYRNEKGTWVVARDGETASSHESLRDAIVKVAGESSPPRGENVPAPKSTPLADDVLRRPQPPTPEDAQPIPPPREPLNMPLPEPELPSKRAEAPEPPAAKPKAQRKPKAEAKPAAEAPQPEAATSDLRAKASELKQRSPFAKAKAEDKAAVAAEKAEASPENADVPEVGDTIYWDTAGGEAFGEVQRIQNGKAGVDYFGYKLVPLDEIKTLKKSERNIARAKRQAEEAEVQKRYQVESDKNTLQKQSDWRTADYRTPELDAKAQAEYKKAYDVIKKAKAEQSKIKPTSSGFSDADQKTYEKWQQKKRAAEELQAQAEAYARKPQSEPDFVAQARARLKDASSGKLAGSGAQQPVRFDPATGKHNGVKLTRGDEFVDADGNRYMLDRDQGFILSLDQVNEKGQFIGKSRSVSVDPTDKGRFLDVFRTGKNLYDDTSTTTSAEPVAPKAWEMPASKWIGEGGTRAERQRALDTWKADIYEALKGGEKVPDDIVKEYAGLSKTKIPASRFDDYAHLFPEVVANAQKRINSRKAKKPNPEAGQGAMFDDMADQAIVSGYKLYKAGMQFKDWTRQMLREFGGKVRPYLRDTWQKLTAAAKEFYRDEEGSAPASPGPPRRNRVTAAVRQNAARQQATPPQAPKTSPVVESEKPLTKTEKAMHLVTSITGVPRAIQATGDFSAPLRQGAILFLPPSQWGRSARATLDMFKSLSPKAHEKLRDRIHGSPDSQVAKDAGLYLATDEVGRNIMTGREEDFISKIAGKIPLAGSVIRASERTYTGFLDSLRMSTFESYKKTIDKAGGSAEQKQAAYKAAAKWINYATGRGTLGKSFDNAAPLLSNIFFAPRYVASRVNVLNPGTYATMPRVVAQRALADLAQYAGMVAMTAYLAKLNGAEVSLDPEDADFLKLKFGDTRYDFLAGTQQVMRLFYRVGKDVKASAEGQPAERGKTALDVAGRFARSKLAPVPSYFMDMVSRKDYVGRPFQADKALIERSVPLLWKDFYEAYQKEAGLGVLKTTPAIFGAGVQDYSRNPIKTASASSGPRRTATRRAATRRASRRRAIGQ